MRASRLLPLLVGVVAMLASAGRARAQLDQPLPPPPQKPATAPKLTKAPAVTKNVEPMYPPEAFAAGLAGDVTLAIDIDVTGHVAAATVTKGAGHGFDEAAVAAGKQMEFSPAEVDGKPSPIRIELTLHFKPVVVAPPVETPPPEPPPEPPPPPPPPPPPAPVVVRGLAREKGTREPIAGADVSVIVRGENATTEAAEIVGATDADGHFEVRANAPRGLRVIVSETAHEPCIRDFTAAESSAATPASWTCSTLRRADTIYETRVKADATHPEETKTTLSKVELTTVPGTMGDPLRVVQSLPGVARAPYGLGLLIVRGADPNDTGTFVDTLNVPQLYHFLVGPSVISANLVEKLDFFPGGFGARYGRFSGGLVDVTLRNDVGHEVHGSVDLNVLDSSVFFEGPVGEGWRVSAALRRSYIDEILPLFIPKKVGSNFVTVVPVYYDYQARAEHDLRNGGKFVLEAFGSDDRIDVVAQDPARSLSIDQHTGSHRVMATWVTPVGAWISTFRPAYGYGVQSFSVGTNTGELRYDRLFIREDLTRSFGKRFSLATGVDGLLSYDLADFDIPMPRDGRSIGASNPDLTAVSRRLYDTAPAVYVEGQWAPTPQLRVVPGLRADYYHVVATDKYNVDPRLSARWTVTPRLAFKGTVGLYHQLPTPQFLDREYGNPNLSLIWADQYELGVERKFTDLINLSVTGFFVRRHDLPVPSVDNFSSTGKGRAYGLEFMLRRELTAHFYGWIAYTLSRAETAGDLAEGVPMGGGSGMAQNGADLSWHPSQFDQTHNLIVVASYARHGWTLGMRYRFVTGTPTTPVVGSFYDADYNGFTRLNGAAGSTRLPNFSQLDVRLEHVWTFDVWSFGAYLDVQNVFNSQNPEGLVYDYRYQQSSPIRGLPILPILGMRGRF
ncbi:MAG TPA: TonB-dependent receptor [Polyangia bacterium]|nr:TonB-dependent receptor [Polyangia bacterium]